MALMAAAVVVAMLAVGCGGGDVGDGDGGGDGEEADRAIAVTATEYRFNAEAGIEIVSGETIEFEVTNVGEVTHEMQVLTGDGKELGRTGEIEPSQSDSVTVTFEEAGVYQVICDIDDHLSRGQQAKFEVAES
jgi:plastocyanin